MKKTVILVVLIFAEIIMDLTVTIASDVDDAGIDCWLLIEPSQRHNGEALIERPMVG